MSLKGRFGNTSGRPYIEGRLHLPRLGLTSDISFCVDTGADSTVLLPSDAQRMGVDYEALGAQVESVGVGGIALDFQEAALVIFAEPKKALHVYIIDILISSPTPDIVTLPSLLGRDILNRWRMTYNPSRNTLAFQVVSADQTIPL